MHFSAIIFVNLGLISSVWDMDSRTSKEEEQYLTFKSSVVRNIVLNRQFKKFDKPIESASLYYDFDYSEFLMATPGFNGTTTRVGTMLHKEQDRNVIAYLSERGLLV